MPSPFRKTPRVPRGRAALALGLAGAMGLSVVSGVSASSHREAPLIQEDPAADNTDLYAFVSPDKPDSVTLIANWIPNQDPGAGPNYYNFGEDVLYSIHIDNDGDAVEDVTYEWRFRTEIQNPKTFLYATNVITSLDDPDYNYRQVQDVFVVRDGVRTQLIAGQIVPPSNIGVATSGQAGQYQTLVNQGTYGFTTPSGTGRTFSGQREDAFFADIASIFDLGQLRPFLPNRTEAGGGPRPAQEGIDTFAGVNVHTTSIQVPLAEVRESAEQPIIQVWSTSSRPKVRVFNQNNSAKPVNRGRFVQVSRLANPLVNEVVIPLGLKDAYNGLEPRNDVAALSPDGGTTIPLVQEPELADLITQLYGIQTPPSPRNDLVSIFLTGIKTFPGAPEGTGNAIEGSQPADLLRLNTSIAPSTNDPNTVNRLGLLGGQADGFPNGRRLGDDVIDIALRAVAGGTPFNPSFNEDGDANNKLADGVDANDQRFLTTFPYQGTPWQGYGENNELRGSTTSGVDTAQGPNQ